MVELEALNVTSIDIQKISCLLVYQFAMS